MCETISVDEFKTRARAYRDRYTNNKLAIYPILTKLRWFKDKSLVYNDNGAVLLECWFDESCPTSRFSSE